MYNKEDFIQEKIQEGRIIKSLKDKGILVKGKTILVKGKVIKLIVIYGRDYSVYDYEKGDFIANVSFDEYTFLKNRRVKCIKETQSKDLPKIAWIKNSPPIINHLNSMIPGMFDRN